MQNVECRIKESEVGGRRVRFWRFGVQFGIFRPSFCLRPSTLVRHSSLSDGGFYISSCGGQASPKASPACNPPVADSIAGRHCGGFTRSTSRSDVGGQVMIFLLMVLLLLSIVLIWNFDLHNVIHLKLRSQNAADASALAAARWQGITLNLIGDLNIMQAVALSAGAGEAARQIAETQARLCYVGPMIALAASQQAAKNNGIYVNPSFGERLAAHANAVLADYHAVFAEPYADCWNEYGAMLMNIAESGVAAGPDNTCFYTDYSAGHTLLTMDFYDAVAGRDWCWFYWYALTLLQTYTDYQSWPALPPQIPETQPENSEVYGLGLTTFAPLPGGDSTVAKMNEIREARGLDPQAVSNFVATSAATWFVYQPTKWGEWAIMKDSSFPIFPEKQVKPQYDYTGADAVTRIEAVSERHMPASSGRQISCTAAAKPFGYLTADDGTQIRPDAYRLVLPAFHDVRLIPVDASSSPSGGAYDLGWREHIEDHLPVYIENGPAGLEADCWYCQQLIAWENSALRQAGIDWLNDTNHSCETFGPGPGPGGGTRRGH